MKLSISAAPVYDLDSECLLAAATLEYDDGEVPVGSLVFSTLEWTRFVSELSPEDNYLCLELRDGDTVIASG